MTLVEVTVVLAILAVLAAVTVPMLTSTRQHDALTAAAGQVRRLVGRVRATAIARAAPTTLVIEPRSGRFWVSAPETTGVLALPDGVTLWSEGPRVRMEFSPSGPVNADVLVLREGARIVQIVFDRWTGEPRDASP